MLIEGKIPGSLPLFLPGGGGKLGGTLQWDYSCDIISTVHTWLVDIMKLKDVSHLNHIMCHMTEMDSTDVTDMSRDYNGWLK